MSGKPRKKDTTPEVEEIVDEPVQTEEVVDDFVEETAETEAATETTNEAKPRRGNAEPRKKKSKSGFKLSSIDPIILVSFTIFMVSCLIVTGVTVYGIVAGDSSAKVCEYGDAVEVNYTGSYFGYYDEQGAAVFDTTMSSVGDNGSYVKSYEYTKKDSYSPLSFTAGQGSYLEDFRDSVIGHKPGDIIKIKIENGYGTLTDGENKFTVSQSGHTINKVITGLTVDKYKELFKADDVPEKGYSATVMSPYGWNAVVYHNNDGTISIDNLAVAGETYSIETDFQIKVNTVAETISFDYLIGAFTENSKMVRAMYYNDVTIDYELVYVIASDDSNMTYKTTDEKTGIDLYFVIEFVGYSS